MLGRSCLGLLLLLYGVCCGSPPTDIPAGADVRLAFVELQAGVHATPRRLVFAVPSLGGVQQPLFDLLLSRALLGTCIDRTTLGHGGLGTRPWRRNISFPSESLIGSTDAAEFWAPRLATVDPQWEALRQAAAACETASTTGVANATRPAQLLLLQLKGVDGSGGLAGLSIVHTNHTSLADTPYVGAAALLSGHEALADIYESVSRRRSAKPCGAHIVETGELFLPSFTADPSSKPMPLPSLMPSLEHEHPSDERLVLPLSRPITLFHAFNPNGGGADGLPADRDVYQYQVSTAGVLRGQKLLLGVLAHDNGQPALLLSYTTAKGAFEEAHWALPVECGTDICSYQRLVVEEAQAQALLLSVRSVSLSHGSERMRFTVHSQPLAVTRLKAGERKRVAVELDEEEEGAPLARVSSASSAPSSSYSVHMLPAMYFYYVRVPALHELLVHVEANQPVLLAASTEGLVSLVSSSPRLLAEGFPGNPAELLMRSTEKDHTVHIGITLLSPPDGFTITTSVQEAPVPPPQDFSELAMELEATGVLDGLTSSERASIISQVHAEEIALGHLSLPQLSPLRDRRSHELLPVGLGLGFLDPADDATDLLGADSLFLLSLVLLVAGSVLLVTLHCMVKVDQDVAKASASAARGKGKEGRAKGGASSQQKAGSGASAAAPGNKGSLAAQAPSASKSELRRRRASEMGHESPTHNGQAAAAPAPAPVPPKADEAAKGGKAPKAKGGDAAARSAPVAALADAATAQKASKDKSKKGEAAKAAGVSTPAAPLARPAAAETPAGAVAKASAKAAAAKAADGSSGAAGGKRRAAAAEALLHAGRSDESGKASHDKSRRGAAVAGGAAATETPSVHRAVEQGPRVWVAPLTATALDHERELKSSFATWGVVTSVKIKVDGNRASPGYGFVYFKEESAARSLLNHIESGGDAPVFMGRSLLVREAVFKAGSPMAAEAHGTHAAPNGGGAAAAAAAPPAPAPAAAAASGARHGGGWLQAVRQNVGGAPAPAAAAVAAGAPAPAPFVSAWDTPAPAAAAPAHRFPNGLAVAAVASPVPSRPDASTNRLSGLRIDPFGGTAALPGMDGPPSAGIHSALDELGSSMLRDLLDSPPAAHTDGPVGAPRRAAAHDSWGLGASAQASGGWGHRSADSFGPRDHSARQGLAKSAPSLGGFGSPAPASASPWWNSGGGAFGGLPIPSSGSGSSLNGSLGGLPLPLSKGAAPASALLSGGGSEWGGFGVPGLGGLPPAGQYAGQRRRSDGGDGWAQ